jgi:Fic family protein
MNLLELLKQMQVPTPEATTASLVERLKVLPPECTAYAAAETWGCSHNTANKRLREAERGGLVKRRPEKDAAGRIVWMRKGTK